MKKANDYQIGGDHYKSKIPHWDYVVANNIPYLEAVAIKYLTRWRDKGGIADILKAQHFIQKLLEVENEKCDHQWELDCWGTSGGGRRCMKCKFPYKEWSRLFGSEPVLYRRPEDTPEGCDECGTQHKPSPVCPGNGGQQEPPKILNPPKVVSPPPDHPAPFGYVYDGTEDHPMWDDEDGLEKQPK